MFEFDEQKVYSEMYLHVIWSTKNQEPLFNLSSSQYVYEYIRELVLECDCEVVGGNVFQEHLELIIKFSPNTVLSNLLTTIKTATTLLIKTNFPDSKNFEWQESDFAFSISREDVGTVLEKLDHKRSFTKKIYSLLDECQAEYDKLDVLT